MTVSGGVISDKLLEKGLSVVRARKLFYSLGMYYYSIIHIYFNISDVMN